MAKKSKPRPTPPKRRATKARALPPPPKVQGTSSQQLAELFDCTTRQIELWAQQKIVVRVGHGLYNAALSTRNVVRHLRAQAAGRAGIDPNSDTAEANAEKSREQTAFTRAKRLKFQGSLVEVDGVRALWTDIIAGVRQFMLGLPGQIAVKVPTLNPQDRREVEQLCRDGLVELSLARGFQVRSDAPPEAPTTPPADDVSDQ